MIKTELIAVDKRQLRRTWSDAGFMIERDGAMYSEAVDPVEIEVMEDDTEKEGEYARDNFENCWKQYHYRI